jgi:hypothetical protein
MPRKSIAILTNIRHVGISTPIMETIKYLTMNGVEVHLYTLRQLQKIDNSWENTERLKLFVRPKSILTRIVGTIRTLKNSGPYIAILNFDHESIIEYGLSMVFSNTYSIFHSLEIHSRKDKLYSGRGLISFVIHMIIINRSNLILTQDVGRRALLSKIYRVNSSKIKILPNSSMGKINSQKHDYFRQQFKLPLRDKLVLLTGSLMDEHCIDEIIKSTDNWPENFKLIVHGWFTHSNYTKKIVKHIKDRPGRVFLSSEILSDQDKIIIFQSVEYGLVFFKPINDNMTHAIGSAGKLYSFMQHGIPIISNNLPGAKELIDQACIGKSTRRYAEISGALEDIQDNYNSYRENCFNQFKKFEFKAHADECYSSLLSRQS